ncbi:hypothetical protein [Treponema sp. Marseille-Q4130]|uniref:hypothetical protein n=1 Tax=Treponema sp. Marseille-Q4130 TaxID=2766702 RepID=UPI001652967E|nr:hypothetical protein [Treponema sp. Marseille-Q4130]MBC6720307.1 hypothetical protein [Treponema sp. Marseille-Q4130]DAU96566.1 MAG TPA: hypothetical protein [Caudoviricetes sp.]
MKKHCDNVFLWLYYDFCKEYARIPMSFDEMLIGIACKRARDEIQEMSIER